MFRVTLIDAKTVDGETSYYVEHAQGDAAQHEAVTFVSEGGGVNAAYHITRHQEKTVYWSGSREAWIEPPLAVGEQ